MNLLIISTSLILFISAAGVIQAIVLAGLLFFHPKSDRSVNSFLSLHILAVSIFMLMPVAQHSFSWHSIILLVPFQFLIGPFLYLYVCSFKEAITWQKAWPHFLLFAVFLVLDIRAYFDWMKKYPPSKEIPAEVLLYPGSYIRIIIRNLQMIAYFFLAKKVLGNYQKSIHHLFSDTSRINLVWMRWLLNGFLFLIISVLILFYLVFTYPQQFGLFILLNTAIITPYIYMVTMKGLGQPTLWQIQPGKGRQEIEKEIAAAEIIGSSAKEERQNQPLVKGMQQDEAVKIITRIVHLMEKDKLYQQPELTLQALSDKLGIQPYQASQLINDGLNKSFYDLVNSNRVEEAKRLLLDPKNMGYTILSIGFEAGFNSKTTFNSVFKKFTGLTPSEFREKHKQESTDL